MKDITFLETGQALVCAIGRWNSPLDGYRANPDCWQAVPESVAVAIGPLYAGEYDVLPAAQFPELAESLRARAERWHDRRMPWAKDRNPYRQAVTA